MGVRAGSADDQSARCNVPSTAPRRRGCRFVLPPGVYRAGA